MIDFEKLDTTSLLELIPEHFPGQVREDDRFECKAASLLTQKHELKKELGVQVSAFSNSGGGVLVFGINGKTRALEACQDQMGNQSMSDYLDQLLELCVDPPTRSFRVHRIPFDGDKSKGVYLIDIWDSTGAPHQAKELVQYFYRSGNQSKAAPHFYLELLRHRYTKAILAVETVAWEISHIDFEHARLGLRLAIVLKNGSMQCATNWGIHVRHSKEFLSWQDANRQNLGDGFCVHGGDTHIGTDSMVTNANGLGFMQLNKQRVPQMVLLPGEKRQIILELEGTPNSNQGFAYEKLFENFGIIIRPVSHNHVGEEVLYGNPNKDWWNDCIHFRRTLKEHEEGFTRQNG